MPKQPRFNFIFDRPVETFSIMMCWPRVRTKFQFPQWGCKDLSKMFNMLNEGNQNVVAAVLLTSTYRKL
jgi:hypothetical protein